MTPPAKAEIFPRFLEAVADISRFDPVLAAVSGGCDSVVLLDLLRAAKFENIIIAHFHHEVRPQDCELDAIFVADLARKLNLPCVLDRGNTPARAAEFHESIEEAGRILRRAFFVRAAMEHHANMVFVAHHAGDVAETLLFNLSRGSGSRGLSSLRRRSRLDQENIEIVRPLLSFTRPELEAYAAERNLDFREDTTNASLEFTRSRIRHQVIPALAAAIGFDPIPAFARTARILADEEEWIASLIAEEALQTTLSTRALAAMPIARQRRLLHAWIARLTQSAPNFTTIERARLLALSKSPPAKINLPNNHHLRRRTRQLFIE